MIESTYTKLFSSIITSTIWREDDKTRIVWITLLALKNRHGHVAGSIPGLAAMANVSIPDCEAALQRLLSPDPYSRTKENDGRRIEIIDGGWSILNHARYRNAMSEEERRAYQAEWQRKYRQRKKDSVDTSVDRFTSTLTHADTEADTDTNKRGSASVDSTPKARSLSPSQLRIEKDRELSRIANELKPMAPLSEYPKESKSYKRKVELLERQKVLRSELGVVA